jgi:hypothetical protein
MGVISTRRRTDPGEDWPGKMLRQTPPKVAVKHVPTAGRVSAGRCCEGAGPRGPRDGDAFRALRGLTEMAGAM